MARLKEETGHEPETVTGDTETERGGRTDQIRREEMEQVKERKVEEEEGKGQEEKEEGRKNEEEGRRRRRS